MVNKIITNRKFVRIGKYLICHTGESTNWNNNTYIVMYSYKLFIQYYFFFLFVGCKWIVMHSCRLFLLYFHLLFFGGRPQATVKSQFLNNTLGIDNENICPRICTAAQLPPENEICLFSIVLYPLLVSCVGTQQIRIETFTVHSSNFVSSAAKRPSVIKSTFLCYIVYNI